MVYHSSVLHHSLVLFHHSSVLHHSSLLRHSSVLHHSSLMHHSSVLRHSSVLHHSLMLWHYSGYSLATVLCHVIMLLYNSTSSNNLATDSNTPCRLFYCAVEILVLASTEHFAYLSTHLFYCRDSASLTSSSRRSLPCSWTTYQFCLLSIIVTLRSTPFILCISTLSCLHFCIC